MGHSCFTICIQIYNLRKIQNSAFQFFQDKTWVRISLRIQNDHSLRRLSVECSETTDKHNTFLFHPVFIFKRCTSDSIYVSVSSAYNTLKCIVHLSVLIKFHNIPDWLSIKGSKCSDYNERFVTQHTSIFYFSRCSRQ